MEKMCEGEKEGERGRERREREVSERLEKLFRKEANSQGCRDTSWSSSSSW